MAQKLPTKPPRPTRVPTAAEVEHRRQVRAPAPRRGAMPTLERVRRMRADDDALRRRRAADDATWGRLYEAQEASSRRWAAEQEAALLAPPVEDALDLADADAADEYVVPDDPPAPDIAQRLEGLSREQLLALVGTPSLDGVDQDDASLRRDLISWVDEGGEAGRAEATRLLVEDIANLPTEPVVLDDDLAGLPDPPAPEAAR